MWDDEQASQLKPKLARDVQERFVFPRLGQEPTPQRWDSFGRSLRHWPTFHVEKTTVEVLDGSNFVA